MPMKPEVTTLAHWQMVWDRKELNARQMEIASGLAFLKRYDSALVSTESDSTQRRERAWASLCQILLASNEFIYIN